MTCLCKRFAVPGLRTLLEGVIGQSLAPENVGSLLLISDQIGAKSLRQSCISFIEQSKDALRSTEEYQEVAAEVDLVIQSARQATDAVVYEDVMWCQTTDPTLERRILSQTQ